MLAEHKMYFACHNLILSLKLGMERIFLVVVYSQDLCMTILARDEIKAGEPIYHGYARSFNTTTMRRVMLFSGKHFGCECVRCTDPTEMGSYCSALICQGCKNASSQTCFDEIAVLPEHPIDLNSPWKCRKCSAPSNMTGESQLGRFIFEVNGNAQKKSQCS